MIQYEFLKTAREKKLAADALMMVDLWSFDMARILARFHKDSLMNNNDEY
jgi:hypothetical protein